MLNRLSLNRIGLNRIGLNRIGKPSGGSSDRPYIDPKVLNSLCGVWIMDQNTNESESRNIIKNKIADRGGDLELLNFGYKLNSGYNGYAIDFTSWSRLIGIKVFSNKFIIENKAFNCAYYVRDKGEDLDEFKAKITNHTDGIIRYGYINQNGVITYLDITPDNSNRVITFPKSYNSIEGLPNHICGFQTPMFVNTGLTIEQLPLYEGALVTDGKDDMIVSQKTVQEMGITNEITVVSMIHHISNSVYHTNYIRSNTRLLKNYLFETSCGKSFIYGYTATNVGVTGTPNGKLTDVILGDKKDLYTVASNYTGIDSDSKFSIEGCINNVDNSLRELSEVAVYWTFIANKVLTTDEINQIIGYFKLDKYVTPQVIYDVKRQGLTNDTPAADWYLKDFSGNGYDMQLYNYAKKGNSGIGKYEADYSTWIKTEGVTSTSFGFKIIEPTHNYWLLYTSNVTIPAHKVLISGIPEGGELRYLGVNILINGINELPEMAEHPSAIGFTLHRGTTQPGDWVGLSVEQIPDYEGALVSDGKDDYGHADNLPIFKDYTVAIDRAWINSLDKNQCLATKNPDPNWGAFNFELLEGTTKNTYSFGGVNNNVSFDANRKISYQSKYSYNGSAINMGNVSDGKDLFLFRSRSAFPYYAEAAIWSYLLFPYSLSEFLLERQLKKYKLGTLYPDMVEWRPVIKSNVSYDNIVFYYQNNKIENGTYLAIGSSISMHIRLSSNPANEIKAITVNGVPATFSYHENSNNVFIYNFNLTDKSPQKIDITIDEYIRFEDIVQPYPYVVKLQSLDGHIYTYGDKLRIGDKIKRGEAINLLPGLYEGRGLTLNGVQITSNEAIITISKSMVFTANKIWLLDTTEPHAIYSPQKLNIPNSSLKILGYVPDLTGKGNHGKLNNFAYTEDSGVTADGSVKFDGTDDHITIPTLAHGGKCVMMKVNWNKNNSMLYDQRVSYSTKFAVLINAGTIAYNQTNPLGVTYIDGIENTNILCDELKGITHNIVSANANPDNSKSPNIGVNLEGNGGFSDMSLYEFMLFPEIPSEDEIKKLNNVMGIEGGYVESPNYYWDSFGKSNNQADDIDKGIRNINNSRIYLFDKSVEGLSTIEQINISGQIRPLLNRALQLKNVGYNSESGYNGYIELLFNKWSVSINENRAEIDRTGTTLNITKVYIQNKAILYCGIGHYLADIPSKYKITGVDDTHPIKFGNDGFPNELILTVTKDGEYEVDWYNYGKNPCIMAGFIGDCNITIEQVAQYPNGLLLDGVEDHAVNTVIPAVTDFTVIAKRSTLDTNINSAFVTKGTSNTYNKAAFMLEFKSSASIQIGSFGILNNGQNIPDLITYMTPTDYNKAGISKGTAIDENGLIMGKYSNTHYWNGVFYKLMFYTKTIDQLSINMLKNLFERDELIDVTNPIFKKQ